MEGKINETIDATGGMTPEQVKIEQQKEAMKRIAKWTPRQKAAFEFLKTLEAYAEYDVNPEELTLTRINNIEKFAENPKAVMPSSRYNEKTGSFEAEGKTYDYK